MHVGDGLEGARRVLVYGVTGSGKTTVAARICDATGIPWTSFDDLTWQPSRVAGLVPRSGELAPGPARDEADEDTHGEARR